MLKLEEVTEQEATEYFLKDPELCYMALPDHDLVSLYNEKKWYKSPSSHLLGVKVDGELIFLMKYEFFTPVAINVHFYLKTKLRDTGIFKDIEKLIALWIYNQTTVRKVLAMTPITCPRIAHVCEKFGLKKEGHLTKTIKWRNEIVDLLIYGLDLENHVNGN